MSGTEKLALIQATAQVVSAYATNLPPGVDIAQVTQDVARALSGAYIAPAEKPHPLSYLPSQQRKRKYKPRAPKLDKLVEGINATNRHPETDTGPAVGNEFPNNKGETKAGGWKKLT